MKKKLNLQKSSFQEREENSQDTLQLLQYSPYDQLAYSSPENGKNEIRASVKGFPQKSLRQSRYLKVEAMSTLYSLYTQARTK